MRKKVNKVKKQKSEKKFKDAKPLTEDGIFPFKFKYVCVTTKNDGIHFGAMVHYSWETRTAILVESRRIWEWVGAFTQTQICNDGCKEAELSQIAKTPILLPEVIEIIGVTDEARKIIEGYPAGKKVTPG